MEERLYSEGIAKVEAQSAEEWKQEHSQCQPDFCMLGEDRSCPEAEVWFDDRD